MTEYKDVFAFEVEEMPGSDLSALTQNLLTSGCRICKYLVLRFIRVGCKTRGQSATKEKQFGISDRNGCAYQLKCVNQHKAAEEAVKKLLEAHSSMPISLFLLLGG